MKSWKPWQLVFLAYLLLLNFVVFGVLAFFLLNNNPFDPTPVALAPSAPTVTPPAPEITSLPATVAPPTAISTPVSAQQAPQATKQPEAIPSVNIPPVPPPEQNEPAPAQSASPQATASAATVAPPQTAEPPANNPTASAQQSAPSQPTAPPQATQPTAIAQAQTSSIDTPTPTPSPSPSPTNSPTATNTPTYTPSPTATATHTHTPTPRPTNTPRPTRTSTPTPRPSNTPTHTPTATNTARPTATKTATPTRTPTATNTPRPSATATHTPTQSPTATSTPKPTRTSTATPTATPTNTPRPSATPTNTRTPTPKPTASPTPQAVARVTAQPTTAAASALGAAAALIDATPLTNGSIALSWQQADKALQYRIYSNMGAGYGVFIYKARATQPAFVDKQLRPGLTYQYRLTRREADEEIVIGQVKTNTFGNNAQAGALVSSQPQVTTASVAAAPTALPSDAVLLGLVSDNNFTDDFNTLTLVGEVRNDSNLDVGQTDIHVTFYDAAGAIIDTASGTTLLDIIPPGEKSPYHITLTRPPGFASYSLRAVARPVSPQQTAQLNVVEVRRFEDDAGFFHIKGTIENVGSSVSKRTKAAAVIYARNGQVINVGFTYVNPPILSPGQQASYDIIFAYYPRYFSQQVIPFEE